MEFYTAGEIVLRLVTATAIGASIGLNRQLKHKPAGLRTHALVALGAAVVTAIVAGDSDGFSLEHRDALSRVIQGIITGIGFLGAGVILRTTNGRSVHGLTTAGSIWLAACLGSACGAGTWIIAIAAFMLVMLVLVVGGSVERWAMSKTNRRAEENEPEPDRAEGS